MNAVRERCDEKDVAPSPSSGGQLQKHATISCQHETSIPAGQGTKTLTDKFGGVDRIPTLFVFDRNGREAFSFVHLQGAEKMHVETDELIGVLDALQ